ncbi:transcriptional corepressor SEUSS [Typha latifolia]|uniref:transcriptional corepressor SEUSS n=1 Tax=Typha latifolia TaxID=4733 RepID=UPI003C3050E8
MVPSGPSTPVGGAQPVPPSHLRANSGMLGGGQPGSIPSQQPFSSIVSPRTQFNNNNMSLLGNISNVSSLHNHSLGNGGPVSCSGISNPSSASLQQRGVSVGSVDMLGQVDPESLLFTSSSGMDQGQQFQNSSNNQIAADQQQSQQIEGMQNFQQQLTMQQNRQQTQLRGGLGNVGTMGPVKLEPQMGPSDQNGQQLQSLRGMGAVKMEQQHMQSMRTLGPVKLEHSDSSLFLQQQQQQHHQQQQQHQQHLLQMSRQSSQAAAAQLSLLQQQRMLQLQQRQQQQQHQQQQILKTLPQQRNQLQQQLQPSLPVRPQVKSTLYEPGMCARRLTHYMYHQQHRPEDNNIEFWRKFVAEYFAPNAKKRWCVSFYGSGRQTTGVFPQDVWHCEICNRKPGRGFETTVEVLPRLFQIKYASGTLEELLYVDMPREYQNASGQIVLDYAKAIQESVFEQLRVVREGQLRIVFSPDLKICSWEFCARHHEELIPRRLLIPQLSQLGAAVQKYQNASQNASTSVFVQGLQNNCDSFVASARQLAKALEVPLVNDLGYTKRYVRCLQISEVVNSMKDLIDYSRETGKGPMDSLINFPRRTSASSALYPQQVRLPEDQQTISQSTTYNDQNSAQATAVQISSANNGAVTASNSLNNLPSTCSTTTIAGLLHQNSMNARQENQMSNANSPYGGGNTVQIPSASSSNSIPPSQPNVSSPFPSPTPSTSNNNMIPTSHNAAHLSSANSPANMSALQQSATQSHQADPTESPSSVQQILQEMMMTSQLNGVGAMRNDMKGINGVTPAMNGGNCLVGNGIENNASIGGMGYGSIGGMGTSGAVSGMIAAMSNNVMAMNGRVGMNNITQDPTAMNHQQQQDMGNKLLGGLGTVNSFNSLQFDWKTSP